MARHPDQFGTRAGAACPLLQALPGRMTALATHTPLDASPGRFWRHMNANARVFIHVADAKLAVSVAWRLHACRLEESTARGSST